MVVIVVVVVVGRSILVTSAGFHILGFFRFGAGCPKCERLGILKRGVFTDVLPLAVAVNVARILGHAPPTQHSEQHHDRFSRFCRTHVGNRQTDRQTDRHTVYSNRPYLHNAEGLVGEEEWGQPERGLGRGLAFPPKAQGGKK